LVLAADPTAALGAATKQYVDSHGNPVLVADTPPAIASTPDASLWWESDTGVLYILYNDSTSRQWVVASPQVDATQFVNKTGDTMTGLLTASGGVTTPSATITGGTINGTVIGGTAPAAGSFAQMTATAGVQVNGGIAGSNWTTVGYPKYVNFGSQSPVIHWNKAGGTYSWGVGVNADTFFISNSTADDNTGTETRLFNISGTGNAALHGGQLAIAPPPSTNAVLSMQKPASGLTNQINTQTGAALRWAMVLGDQTPEAGSNSGSDFELYAFQDNGSTSATVMKILRATGVVSFPQGQSDLNGWQFAGTRNLVHNGAFEIDQRYAFVTTTMNAANQYCADRWMFVSTQTGKFNTTAGVNTALTLGMTRCLQVSCIVSVPSPAAGDTWSIQHRIEGWNFARLGYGASLAQPATLSFVAYSSLAGTYAVSIRNNAGNRSLVQTFTLAASTWTKFAIPIPGDTAGTWLGDTGIGGIVTFSLASGTTWNAPAAGSWQAGNFMSVAGTTNFLSATPTFYLSDVQLELGNVATPFEHLDFAQKLAICQRYYWQDTYTYLVFNGAAATQIVSGIIKFPQVMRTAPTMTYATAPTVVETTTSHLLAYGNVAASTWLALGLVTASADI
jgi:hypothetical protein